MLAIPAASQAVVQINGLLLLLEDDKLSLRDRIRNCSVLHTGGT